MKLIIFFLSCLLALLSIILAGTSVTPGTAANLMATSILFTIISIIIKPSNKHKSL